MIDLATRAFVLALALLCSCASPAPRRAPASRSAPQRTCYPASGREVWIERHLRARQSTDGRVPVEVRFAPDTSEERRRSQQASLRISRVRDQQAQQPIHQYVTKKTPAMVRLVPGTYRFVVYSITYEHAAHLVEVAAEDSIVVEAQLHGAAYCDEILELRHP